MLANLKRDPKIRLALHLCLWLAFLVLAFRPALTQLRLERHKLLGLEERQRQLVLFAKRYDPGTAAQTEEQWQQLRRQVPDQVTREEAVSRLEALCRESGVRLLSLEAQAPGREAGGTYLPLSLALEGDYTQLLLFHQLWEQEPGTFQWTESSTEWKNRNSMLNFHGKLKIFATKNGQKS